MVRNNSFHFNFYAAVILTFPLLIVVLLKSPGFYPYSYLDADKIDEYGQNHPKCQNPLFENYSFNSVVRYDCDRYSDLQRVRCSRKCYSDGPRKYVYDKEYYGCYEISLKNDSYTYTHTYLDNCYANVSVDDVSTVIFHSYLNGGILCLEFLIVICTYVIINFLASWKMI